MTQIIRRGKHIVTIPAIIAIVYGALVLLGGWMGYAKAKSKPSLMAGSISGALLWITALLSLSGNPLGPRMALVVGTLLFLLFAYRFAKGRKFMPSGLMALISLISVAAIWFTSGS